MNTRLPFKALSHPHGSGEEGNSGVNRVFVPPPTAPIIPPPAHGKRRRVVIRGHERRGSGWLDNHSQVFIVALNNNPDSGLDRAKTAAPAVLAHVQLGRIFESPRAHPSRKATLFSETLPEGSRYIETRRKSPFSLTTFVFLHAQGNSLVTIS